MKGIRFVSIVFSILGIFVASLGCSTEVEDPRKPIGTTTFDSQRGALEIGHVEFQWDNPPSLERQILDADTIVVATFVSATPGVRTKSHTPGVTSYMPVQVLQFQGSEYLKGTGPTEFTVEVPTLEVQYTDLYETREKAVEIATQQISNRDASYDSRPGVLLLYGPLSSTTSGGDSTAEGASIESSGNAFNFVLGNVRQESWKYSINTLERGWMPAKELSSDGSDRARAVSETSSDSEYITEGSKQPPEVITLADLRSKIAGMEARLTVGEGIDGYRECIDSELRNERHFRGKPRTVETFSLPTGSDPEVHIFHRSTKRRGHEVYTNYSEAGPNAEYFKTLIIDDDEEPSNGYYYTIGPNRPLPAGDFEVIFVRQLPIDQPCDFLAQTYPISQVTVTAPAGTLHESFFDPVAIGTGVGADGTNGVLSPTSFTVGGTATEMTGLNWENNQVVLTLSPHASLTNHVLDFIELDGSVSLSLRSHDGTQDSAAGTHTWTVPTQPWHNGDLLMLRIRRQ